MGFDPGGISSAHASPTARATIDFRLPATIDFGLWPELEDQVALTLALFFRVNLDALIAQMSPETFHDDPFAAAPVVGAEIW